MANSIITFFPVEENNGGMVLFRLNDTHGTTILIDVCVGDDSIAKHCDVALELRDRLPTDNEGRPYVDAFILTHRHQDHLKGIQKHFHLGAISDYEEAPEEEEPKILIRELWSSYHFWKKASTNYNLCGDAKAFNKEMKRRVELFKSENKIQIEGERAIIVGQDPNGNCDGLTSIVYDIGDIFTKINNHNISTKFFGEILGPLYKQEAEDDDAFNDKNRQSIILNLTVKEGEYSNKILLSSDAECFVWENLWDLYENDIAKLEYDIMQAPHHCSWHSLSYDSQSKDENPQVCGNAKLALSQTKTGACIVSQSKPIKNNDADPPSKAAKDEYLTIIDKSRFYCTNEYPSEDKPEPLEFNLTNAGPQRKALKEKSKLSVAALASTKESYSHG